MSQENVDIVRGIWEADRRRDSAAVYAAYAPNIDWEDHAGHWGDWGVARGPDGIRQAWRRWYEAFETYGWSSARSRTEATSSSSLTSSGREGGAAASTFSRP